MKSAADNFLNWFSSTYGKLTTVVLFTILIVKGTIMFINKQEADIKFQSDVRVRLNNIDSIGKEIMNTHEFSKVRSKLVLKALGAAYYVTDSIGQTIEVSDEATMITGWPKNELMGNKWNSHIIEPDRTNMSAYMKSTLESKTDFAYTYRMMKPDNTRVKIKTLADRVHYVNQPYRTRGYVGVIIKSID